MFRRPQGYGRRFDYHQETGHEHIDLAFGDKIMAPTVECDTFTCKHCQRIVAVQPKARPEDVGGLCKPCMGLICPACVTRAQKYGCEPFIQKVEQIEHRERMLLSYLGE